jgi:hypothetical protein
VESTSQAMPVAYPNDAESGVRRLVVAVLEWGLPEREGVSMVPLLETAEALNRVADDSEQSSSVARPATLLRAAIHENLVAWRQAERELEGDALTSTAWPDLEARLAGYRSSYQRLFREYLDLDADAAPSWFSRTRQTASALLPRLFVLDRELTTRR